MNRVLFFILFAIGCAGSVMAQPMGFRNSQEKVYVVFTDKHNVSFNPYRYFDKKAIERRQKQHLPLYDSTDLPLSSQYVEQIKSIADSVGYQLRWFNMLVAWITPKEAEKIMALPFVKTIVYPLSKTPVLCSIAKDKPYDTLLKETQEAILKDQLQAMQGETFIKNGFNGKGIRIAIFDAGFPTVDTNPVFAHIRQKHHILKTWDFVRNKENVYKHNSHGLMTFSCIAGKLGDKQIGLATESEFLLARTEQWREPFSEEENWMKALEWADKNGADIISSSLGYTTPRYFKSDMDGHTSYVTRAANLAARKGILVINAAGNEADSKWRTLGAPADADSILTIGGVKPFSHYHISFSSVGPTHDGRLKPNVVALGHATLAGKHGLTDAYGTSFSTPLVAGFAACAWQAQPKLTNMQLAFAIQHSATLFPYFDYAHGFGIPQADFFVHEMKRPPELHQYHYVFRNDTLVVELTRQLDTTREDNYFYYKILSPNHKIDRYFVVAIRQKQFLKIPITKDLSGYTIESTYRNDFQRYKFP